MFELQILRSPHLMLADARREYSLTINKLVETLQHVLRLDQPSLSIIVVRMLLSEPTKVAQPRRKVFRKIFADPDQVGQRSFRVPDMRPVNGLDLAEFREINVDVRD